MGGLTVKRWDKTERKDEKTVVSSPKPFEFESGAQRLGGRDRPARHFHLRVLASRLGAVAAHRGR